jgi:5-methylcytosine-specific restriction endonuclease McrA
MSIAFKIIIMRTTLCQKCGKTLVAGKRGALPKYCDDCKPHYYIKPNYIRKPIDSFPGGHLVRIKVLERDNYTCQTCGCKTHLDVHHKDGKSYKKMRKKANNAFDNLITLCRTCHNIQHAKNGTWSTQKIERNKSLVEYYNKHPQISYAALGRIFKLSRERVRQILSKYAH